MATFFAYLFLIMKAEVTIKMADSTSRRKPTFLRKRFSAAKVLELILAKTDSEEELTKDSISADESDEDFVPDKPTSEIEDHVHSIENSSTDDSSTIDEQHEDNDEVCID